MSASSQQDRAAGRPAGSKQDLFSSVPSNPVFHEDASVILKPCALCGGTRGKRLYMQAHFPVVTCRECGLIYADEHFQEEQLREFYSGDYYERAYICHPPEIDQKIANGYARAFEKVAARQPEGGRLLDFGCARGTFLSELVKRGHHERWVLEGLDINPDEVAMGRAQGLDIHCGTLESVDLPAEGYDLVCSFSVLEHLQDPVGEMVRVARLLRPGGRFLAIVPAGSCLIIRLAVLASRVLKERVRGFTDNVFHEEHLYYFTRKTWKRALEHAGLEVESFFGQPSYLETHPPSPLVAVGAYGLRFVSWAFRRQTMLGVVAVKPEAQGS